MKIKTLSVAFLSLIFVLLMSLNCLAIIPGDVSSDAHVTIDDARLVLRAAIGLEKFSEDQNKTADVDNDGKVTISDARLVLRVAIGLETFNTGTLSYIENIYMTPIPYSTNGVKLTSVTRSGNKLTFTVVNNSGEALGTGTRIPYICYDAAGNIINASYFYFQSKLNNGDSCDSYLYVDKNTSKLLLGLAKLEVIEPFVVSKTTVINGMTVTETPYSNSGIKISNLSFDNATRNVTVRLTNNTGSAISSCSMTYKCFDSTGKILLSGSIASSGLSAGEFSNESFKYPAGTTKIIFDQGNSYAGSAFIASSSKTEKISGIEFTKSPITASGLIIKVENVEADSYSTDVTFLITNKTGNAISDMTNIPYKVYSSDGSVTGSSSFYSMGLNNGESCRKTIYLYDNPTKILIGEPNVKSGQSYTLPSLRPINGVSVNVEKYKLNGLVFSDFEVIDFSKNYNEVSFRITNKTGKAISDSSFISLNQYGEDGVVIGYNSIYVSGVLNNGEYCDVSVTVEKTVAKLAIIKASIYETASIHESSSYLNINGMKCTSGFATSYAKISSVEYDSSENKLWIVVQNISGSSLKSGSVKVKFVGSSGQVLDTKTVSVYSMGKGETSKDYCWVPDGATKAIIYDITSTPN